MISSALAKAMYEGYRSHNNGVNREGQAIAPWDKLSEAVRQDWIVAAEAGRQALIESMNLELNEVSQLRLARYYINNHADARLSGHNTLTILSKMATALGIR